MEVDEKGDNAVKALLSFTAVLCISSSALLIGLQEKFVKEGTPEVWNQYNLTSILVFGYVRLLLHATTKKMMQQTSPSYRSLPPTRADDTAWSIIDAISFLLWAPILAFFLVRAFALGDDQDRLHKELFPFSKILCATYMVDRVMQQVVFTDAQRLIHHAACAIIILVQFEWIPQSFNPLAIMLCIIEVSFKPGFAWTASHRLMRAHAKRVSAAAGLPSSIRIGSSISAATVTMRLDEIEIRGSDRFFVYVNPQTAAKITRVIYVTFVGAGAILLPAVCMVSYIGLKSGNIPMSWKILSPLAILMFGIVDFPFHKWFWVRTKVSYWETSIFETSQATTAMPKKEELPRKCTGVTACVTASHHASSDSLEDFSDDTTIDYTSNEV